MNETNSNSLGEISFYKGGAISKELKGDKDFRNLTISFVSGPSQAKQQKSKDPQEDKFIVGIDSNEAKGVLQIIDAEKPWEWEGLQAIPFSNGLYFEGKVGERKWKRTSVYPDRKLEPLLKQLRRAVSQ